MDKITGLNAQPPIKCFDFHENYPIQWVRASYIRSSTMAEIVALFAHRPSYENGQLMSNWPVALFMR
jgi:hypothetical protein